MVTQNVTLPVTAPPATFPAMATNDVVTAYILHGQAQLSRQGAACAACAQASRATQTRRLGYPAHGFDRDDVIPLCDTCARAHDRALRVVGQP